MAGSQGFPSAPGWQNHGSDNSPNANKSDHHGSTSQNLPTARSQGQVASWRVADLRPHPAYARIGITTPAPRLNALLEMGDDAFLFPLIVTSEGIVIDGYARLEVARLQGRSTVECVQYDITEREALRRLIYCHRPSPGLPAFARIDMSRDLAKRLKEKALQHQQAGGKDKGSSKLTEAQKIDVRKKIAVIVGISVGTLSHASDVLKNADPEVLRALYNGEIKIDRAWRWSKQSKMRQRESLQLYRRNRGMEKVAQKFAQNRDSLRYVALRLASSPREPATQFLSILSNCAALDGH
jgi:ParB-like chromosome segregation protein Spo0J